MSTHRRRAFAAYPHECVRCSSRERLIVHHIDRNTKNNSISNLQILCRDCHHWEHHLRHREEWDAQMKAEWAQEARKSRERELLARQCVETVAVTVELPRAIVDLYLQRSGTGDISQLVVSGVLRSAGFDLEPYQHLLHWQSVTEGAA